MCWLWSRNRWIRHAQYSESFCNKTSDSLKVCHPRYVRSITQSCSVYISIYTYRAETCSCILHILYYSSRSVHNWKLTLAILWTQNASRHLDRFLSNSFIYIYIYIYIHTHIYTRCFKKSFTTLKAYRNFYRGHTQRFELSKYSKTHRVLPRIVMVQCDFHW